MKHPVIINSRGITRKKHWLDKYFGVNGDMFRYNTTTPAVVSLLEQYRQSNLYK